MTIYEGRKRQIRRMLKAVGSEVITLKRLQIGPLKLGSLPVGMWRVLKPAEVKNLMNFNEKIERGTMKIGIIGAQNSGKTTIFNALTGLDAEVTSYASQKLEPNLGVVDVIDPRITWLKKHYEPKKQSMQRLNISILPAFHRVRNGEMCFPANP